KYLATYFYTPSPRHGGKGGMGGRGVLRRLGTLFTPTLALARLRRRRERSDLPSASGGSGRTSVQVHKREMYTAKPRTSGVPGSRSSSRSAHCSHGALPLYAVGVMFWLWRNRFVGSYLRFRSARRW